jgi:4-methyl-5(b-hydroxyethyl)-thiazole monophosphate biosynthesis
MEAVVIVDVLRRAGAAVTVASVEQERLAVKCSRGVVLTADATLEAALGAVAPFDLIALPGGMPGAERLAASKPLADALRAQREAGRPFAAICAAPAVVLEAQELLDRDQPATAHPAFSGKLANQASVSERVAVAVAAKRGDGKGGSLVLTSRGPGTAFEFALALVAVLFGGEKAREVAGPMVMYGGWEESVGKAVAGAAAAAK